MSKLVFIYSSIPEISDKVFFERPTGYITYPAGQLIMNDYEFSVFGLLVCVIPADAHLTLKYILH